MSDILNLYNSSVKPRIVDAREASEGGEAVNYIDRQNEFQVGWTNDQKLKETTFTDKAQQYYDDELANMVVPQSFTPIETGIPLNRYNPKQGYYKPGQPQD